MSLYKYISYAIVSIALSLAGCDSQNSAIRDDASVEVDSTADLQKQFTPADDSKSTAEGIERLATANNDFAIKMYQQLNQDAPLDNIVFSPYSLSSAMALSYLGAKGATYDEIQRVFDYPKVEEMLPNAAALYNQLNRPNANYSLSSVNELWVQQGATPDKDYADAVTRYLQAKVTPVDFITNPELAVKTINRAMAKRTNNLIPQILSVDNISADTRNILTNALYFKGAWLNEFYEGSTEPLPFRTITPSDTPADVTVDMMHQNSKFAYAEDEQAQIIDLPYQGDEVAMMVILPKAADKQGLEQTIASLSAKKIAAWQAKLDYEDIDLYLPKFKMDVRDDKVADKLEAMGMPTAFSTAADFSGYSETTPLMMSKVVHQAVIIVDEVGTEAAAVTVEMVEDASEVEEPIIPIEFKADHPFIYVIYHKPTRTILFMGQMLKPSNENAESGVS